MHFVKGHGTQNDFILLPDHAESLTPELVRWLCDRRDGIGADGVIRVAHSTQSQAQYFMDYWNANGTVSEMCGNGVRVFARYLVESEREKPGRFRIDTRAGIVHVHVPHTGDISVEMGAVHTGVSTYAVVGEQKLSGIAVRAPNPHCVCITDTHTEEFDLSHPPELDTEVFPEGANCEIVNVSAPYTASMRVYERGSAETRSCGTGAVAVAVALRARYEWTEAEPVRVHVPGGTLSVSGAQNAVVLSGPALLIAEGECRVPAFLTRADTMKSRE